MSKKRRTHKASIEFTLRQLDMLGAILDSYQTASAYMHADDKKNGYADVNKFVPVLHRKIGEARTSIGRKVHIDTQLTRARKYFMGGKE